jgi:transposase
MLRALMDAISDLKQRIRVCGLQLEKLAATLPVTRALRDVVGVGPILSLAFVATLEDPRVRATAIGVLDWMASKSSPSFAAPRTLDPLMHRARLRVRIEAQRTDRGLELIPFDPTNVNLPTKPFPH